MYISFLCSSDHDRIRLKVVGTQCTIHGSNALEKDQGIWDFYISAGNDSSFHKKHFQFHVFVNGKNNILPTYFLNSMIYIIHMICKSNNIFIYLIVGILEPTTVIPDSTTGKLIIVKYK